MNDLKGSNCNSIKMNNRALLVDIIRKNHAISRAKLSLVTGLSRGGITPIISELIGLGMIRECGTSDKSTGSSGRKPTYLEINPSRFYVIAIDFKRKDYIIGLVNFNGDIVYSDRYDFSISDTLESILCNLFNSIHKLLCDKKECKVIGIAVTAPGPLDYKNGVIISPPNFSGWSNIQIKFLLEREFNLPVYLDNNANAFALAEKNYGDAKQYTNFIYLTVDEGIGAGVVIDDRIYRGNGGFGNEIGHITINMNGPKCTCGNYGCLELYGSTPKLVEQVDNAISIGAYSEYLSNIKLQRPIQWDDIVYGLTIKDPLCINILKKETEYIGNALVSVINMIEPQAIIIGSKLAGCGDYIINPLKSFLRERTMTRNIQLPVISVSRLKNGSLIGGASMAIENFIKGGIGSYEEILGQG